MKQERTIKAKCNERPRQDFLQRYLGEDVAALALEPALISKGISYYSADVIANPLQEIPDETAYLHFYPVGDDDHYLQLSFLPDAPQIGERFKVVQIVFGPSFFEQWPMSLICEDQPFRLDRCTEQAFTLGNAALEQLDALNQSVADNKPGFVHILQRQEKAIALLRNALEAFWVPSEANKLPACSFLNNNGERDKVLECQKIIISSLEAPLTIRELSREVGMNECYLKKGFKAMFGKTIHEYQQWQRIEKAKELLTLGTYSINEVAYIMGFGSASHFSTSFKKIAGMKPCELLK